MATYLEVEYTESQLKSLISFVSFDNMKNYPSFDFRNTKGVERYFNDNIQFFKKGQIGNWKNHFSQEMSKEVDDVIAKNLTYKEPIIYEPSN